MHGELCRPSKRQLKWPVAPATQHSMPQVAQCARVLGGFWVDEWRLMPWLDKKLGGLGKPIDAWVKWQRKKLTFGVVSERRECWVLVSWAVLGGLGRKLGMLVEWRPTAMAAISGEEAAVLGPCCKPRLGKQVNAYLTAYSTIQAEQRFAPSLHFLSTARHPIHPRRSIPFGSQSRFSMSFHIFTGHRSRGRLWGRLFVKIATQPAHRWSGVWLAKLQGAALAIPRQPGNFSFKTRSRWGGERLNI